MNHTLRKRTGCVCLLVVLSAWVARGQEPFFRQVELEQATASLRINAMAEDAQGIVWLGTNEGLWKFSGTTFQQFKLPDTLSAEAITALAAVGDSLLAGTRTGRLFSLRSETATLVPANTLSGGAEISDIISLPDGTLLFASLGEGIYAWKENRISAIKTREGLADDFVYCLDVDNRNRIYAGTDRGLVVMSRNLSNRQWEFNTFTTLQGLPENIIRSVTWIEQDRVAVGMEEQGFCILDLRQMSVEKPKCVNHWKGGAVSKIIRGNSGYWFATQRMGLLAYDPDAGGNLNKILRNGPRMHTWTATALLRDHEGNVWTSDGSNLYVSRGYVISFFRDYPGYGQSPIRALMSDAENRIWFVNESGLFMFDPSASMGSQISEPLKGTRYEDLMVISFYQDPYGYIWMGTFDKGVLRFDPASRTGVMIGVPQGLLNPSVMSVAGNGQAVWFATLGGISRCMLETDKLDGFGPFENFESDTTPGKSFVYRVISDSRNRVWFATDGYGILCYDLGKFSQYSLSKGLRSKVIYSLTEDRNGNLWISSPGEGVYRYDGSGFKNFNASNGLSDLNITSLGTDTAGNIIIVNKKGIDIMDPETYQVTGFGSESGIVNLEPDLNVADHDKRGNFWIGSSEGIIRINARSYTTRLTPRLILSQVRCFLEPVDTTTEHAFAYDRNHISFEYAGIWYANPEKVSYQYKLTGYNSEWITTRDRFITFPNLQPGNYRFEVRSSVTGNYNRASVLAYTFRITAPWWQRPWIVTLALIGFVGLAYLYNARRYRRMQAIEQLKKEKIETQYEVLKNQVNPHFLFNSFNTLITVIEDNSEHAVDYVNRLSDFFRSILTNREKDLIPLYEEMKLVDDYIFLQQKRYGRNFTVNRDIPRSVLDQCLVPPMAVQLLLENCFKHNAISRETPLVVTIAYREPDSLLVRNNINERLVRESSTGIGLQNLRNRYQHLGMQQVEIRIENGSFEVKIPLIRAHTIPN